MEEQSLGATLHHCVGASWRTATVDHAHDHTRDDDRYGLWWEPTSPENVMRV